MKSFCMFGYDFCCPCENGEQILYALGTFIPLLYVYVLYSYLVLNSIKLHSINGYADHYSKLILIILDRRAYQITFQLEGTRFGEDYYTCTRNSVPKNSIIRALAFIVRMHTYVHRNRHVCSCTYLLPSLFAPVCWGAGGFAKVHQSRQCALTQLARHTWRPRAPGFVTDAPVTWATSN